MQDRSHILIADDEPTFLAATAELLKDEGYECQCVTNAEEALACLEKKNFDLLVTDINMPGNKDLEILSSVADQNPKLPIIVVTGYPSLPTAITSLRFRVLDYLTKPVELSDLLVSVGRGLEQVRVLDAVAKAKEAATTWAKTLESIEGAFPNTRTQRKHPSGDLDEVVEQSMAQIHTELSGLRIALAQAKGGETNHTQDLCAQIRCARSSDYHKLREAIYQSVEVLQKTKSSFKSKELGMLRTHLKDLLLNTTASS